MKTLVLGVAAFATAPILRVQRALAGNPLAKLDDPLVKALGYVADAKDSKDRKDKKANCKSCQFYVAADDKATQGKCQLIASGEVLAAGWCRSYAVKAKK
ncbi:MAG: high-potential iron-sulfur protein [Bdellovibrionales bacterium]|nr:high-potential iron-sulfur protein [Bdellovibrionales bacterium]